MKPYMVGIAGPSASGKSSVCKALEEDSRVTRIRLDNFFKDGGDVPSFKQWKNWELPQNLKFGELYSALSNLKSGKPAKIPVYSRPEARQSGAQTVYPNDIIVTEGFLLFHDEPVRNIFDLRVFFYISERTQLERRLKRQKGLDVEYFKQVVVPMFERYGLPARRYAHHAIDGERSLEENIKEVKKIVYEGLSRRPL